VFFRFLREPNKYIAPRPVAKSGNALGTGVGGMSPNSSKPKGLWHSEQAALLMMSTV
jgi:hypothetical protein